MDKPTIFYRFFNVDDIKLLVTFCKECNKIIGSMIVEPELMCMRVALQTLENHYKIKFFKDKQLYAFLSDWVFRDDVDGNMKVCEALMEMRSMPEFKCKRIKNSLWLSKKGVKEYKQNSCN